jgi:hypothetical protein
LSQKTKTTFPKAAEGQKESFKLPNKSCIDACYNKHFGITKEWPEYLTKRFDGAEGVVEEICKDKI